MLTSDELSDARADLEDELLDTITFWRDTGQRVTEDVSPFEELPVFAKVYDQVPALVVIEQRGTIQSDQAGEPNILRTYLVTTAVDVSPQVGHIVTVDDSHDPDTADAVMTVRDPRHGSLSLSRRIVCQQNLSVPRFVEG